jgi:NAD(P)-dependent dehydrogenase (short-subunit alcohol dehydrogenase family)
VTGAAHRIGKTFALALAQRGYAILLHHYEAADEAIITAEEIRSLGVPAYPVQANLINDSDLIYLLSTLDSLPHHLSVLVNSASIMQRTNLHDTSSSNWDATFALNLRAPFLLAQHAAKRMEVGGLIVNVTDAGAQKLWTGYPAYVVSKSALESLTRLQAKTYAPGIRVNAIAPGLVLPSANVTPAEWEKLVDQVPLKRSISLEDVAAALTFMLDNPSITGQTIIVDGGYSLI